MTVDIGMLPVWALLASFRLDWAATSTGGAYAAIAGLLALLVFSVGYDSSWLRRLLLYVLFGLVLILTKLPSALVLIPLAAAMEAFHRTRSFPSRGQLKACVIGVSVGGAFMLALLPLMSSLVGNFSIEAKRLPGLLWFYGPLASLATVSIRHVWILMVTAVTWRLVSASAKGQTRSDARSLLLSLAPLLVVGIAMESLVAGGFNTHEYFSGPNYFLASSTILAMVPLLAEKELVPLRRREILIGGAIGIVILIWQETVERLHLPGPIGRAYHPKMKSRMSDCPADLPKVVAQSDAKGRVGLLLLRSYLLSGNSGHYDGVIRAMEGRGLQVVPAFAAGLDARPAIEQFFIADGQPTVDAVVSLSGFSLVGGPAYNDAKAAEEILARLDVP